MLNISGADRGFSGSRDIHCIILDGDATMPEENHPPHMAQAITRAVKKAGRSGRRHLAILAGK